MELATGTFSILSLRDSLESIEISSSLSSTSDCVKTESKFVFFFDSVSSLLKRVFLLDFFCFGGGEVFTRRNNDSFCCFRCFWRSNWGVW